MGNLMSSAIGTVTGGGFDLGELAWMFANEFGISSYIMEQIFGVISVVIFPLLIYSLICCFFGYKLFRFSLAVQGFLGGAVVGAVLGLVAGIGSDSMMVSVVVFASIAGVIGALLTWFLYKLGVFMYGCSISFVVVLVLCILGGMQINTALVTALFLSIIIGIVCVFAIKHAVILVTGISNGVISGILLGILMQAPVGVMLLLAVLFSVGGCVVQYKTNAKHKENNSNGNHEEPYKKPRSVSERTGAAPSSSSRKTYHSHSTCPTCGEPVSSSMARCPRCRTSLVYVEATPTAAPQMAQAPLRFCGSCGKPLDSAGDFCGYCGSRKSDSIAMQRTSESSIATATATVAPVAKTDAYDFTGISPVHHELDATSSVEAAVPLLKRIEIFLEDGVFATAQDYCERVLDIDPQCAYAYLYKLMISYKLSKREQLARLTDDFSESADFDKAMRFGDTELKEELCYLVMESKNKQFMGAYAEAVALMERGKGDSLAAAQRAFDRMGSYKDAQDLSQKCRDELDSRYSEAYNEAREMIYTYDEEFISSAMERLSEMKFYKSAAKLIEIGDDRIFQIRNAEARYYEQYLEGETKEQVTENFIKYSGLYTNAKKANTYELKKPLILLMVCIILFALALSSITADFSRSIKSFLGAVTFLTVFAMMGVGGLVIYRIVMRNTKADEIKRLQEEYYKILDEFFRYKRLYTSLDNIPEFDIRKLVSSPEIKD
ncbi:MAG: hypothetical protein E7478_09525 [Ruminococcaceae bacterium]|nr:hypothetical protein [Oscillospiraceae bacterium]